MQTFEEYYKERELNEMARRKKGKMHKPIAKKKDEPLIIKGEIAPAGHQQLAFRTGAHDDKRTKRQKTRGDKNRRAIGEFG